MSEMTVRDALTDAIRYWELRRIVYNAVLVVVVFIVFVLQWPASRAALTADLVQTLFILAVLANVAYCAAYVVDVVAQYSGFQPTWRRLPVVALRSGCRFREHHHQVYRHGHVWPCSLTARW